MRPRHYIVNGQEIIYYPKIVMPIDDQYDELISTNPRWEGMSVTRPVRCPTCIFPTHKRGELCLCCKIRIAESLWAESFITL